MNSEDIHIRHIWNTNTKQWNYSIVDIIDFVIVTTDARNYWKVLKNRLKKRNIELPYKCNQLKMQAKDGKYYLTDVADAKHILEIVELISDSPPIELEVWIATVENKNFRKSKKGFPQPRPHANKISLIKVLCNRLRSYFHS